MPSSKTQLDKEIAEWFKSSLEESGLWSVRAKLGCEIIAQDLTAVETASAFAGKRKNEPTEVNARYLFPYFDLDGKRTGFERWRYRYEPVPNQKYGQESGTGCHLYLPPLLKVGTWRDVAAEVSEPIWFTEGEKKSARACLAGRSCIGIGGVGCWGTRGKDKRNKRRLIPDFDFFAWEGRQVYIAFDSDFMTKPEVRDELVKFYMTLRDELKTALPRIVHLPPFEDGRKCGLDDYLEDRKDDVAAIEDLCKTASGFSNDDERFAAFNDRYVIDRTIGKVFDKQARKFLSERAFMFATANHRAERLVSGVPTVVPFAKLWSESNLAHRVDGLTYEPGGPATSSSGAYNLWRADTVPEPIENNANVKLFHELMAYLGMTGKVRDQFLAWCAYPIRNVGKKIFWAVVLTGPIRTGKTFLGALVAACYDIGFVDGVYTNTFHLKKSDDLTGKFNTRLQARQFIVADEIVTAHRKELANILKTLIASESIDIEPKGVDVYSMPNHANLFLTSNEASAIYYEEAEGRYLHHSVNVPKLEDGDPVLRRKLREWHNEKQLSGANLRHYFLYDDEITALLKDFDAWAVAIETEALREAREATYSDVEAALARCRDNPATLYYLGKPRTLFEMRDLLTALSRVVYAGSPREVSQYQVLNSRVKPYVRVGQAHLPPDRHMSPSLWAHVNDAEKFKLDKARAEVWLKENPPSQQEGGKYKP